MSFSYPYKSIVKENLKQLREGLDYSVWQSESALSELVVKSKGPIVEIGGPSDGGFYFLDGQELKTKPIITNISSEPAPYGDNAVELAEQVNDLVDGRDMPYADDSVGVFLMSCMSLASDWWTTLDYDEKNKATVQFEQEYDIARLEMGQVALGVMRPEDVKQAQRVQIFCEVYRALRKDGLFFSDGEVEEVVILQQLGFELVALLQYRGERSGRIDNLRYEFVVKK